MARVRTTPFDKALIIESPHPSLDAHLARFGIEAVRLDKVPDQATLIRALQETRAQILFKRSRIEVTEEVLAAAPDLHIVQLCCIGDDSVDKVAAARHGVLVFNDPVSNGRSVVEMAIGLTITLSRRFFEAHDETRDHQWDKSDKERYEILGKRIGIVGLGNIGRQVAKAAEGLGMEVQFYDNRFVAQEVGQEMGWRRSGDLGELFRTSDVVSVHTSARDTFGNDNDGLLDPHLAWLGAERDEPCPRVFLNLARGNLFAPERLIEAVQAGKIRRAAVDVYPEEPRPGLTWTNPYAGVPGIVGTPHIGAATQEAQPRIAARVARTVGLHSRFGALRDCVFSPRSEIGVGQPEPGQAVLGVVHSTRVGTKKAVSDAIFAANVSTLGSTQQDFPNGVAYDLSVLERPLTPAEIRRLVDIAAELSGDPTAIRAVRQVVVEPRWTA
jgi:D-3-phosphoglycerate dehydrogenase